MADIARALNRRSFLVTSGLATAVAVAGAPGPAHAAP
ncbi:twin-arginine translocation signal domain-containing protein, partial [Actinomadura sp. KC216]